MDRKEEILKIILGESPRDGHDEGIDERERERESIREKKRKVRVTIDRKKNSEKKRDESR